MKKTLLLTITFSIIQTASALVTCSPTSCSPGCNSSCTYYTCSKDSSKSFTVIKMPITNEDSEPADACAYTKVQESKLPFTLSGQAYNKIPATVTNKYKSCNPLVVSGPPCPPPPPPPPAAVP